MKVSPLFQTELPVKAFESQTINCSISPTSHSREAAARWAGLKGVLCSYLATIREDVTLSGSPVSKMEEGIHRCCLCRLLFSLKMMPLVLACSQGGRHWKRSQVETEQNEFSFRCDEFEGPVRHQSRAIQ